MNYVKHMNQVFQVFSADDRLSPNHISLYLSLFQEWNGYLFAKRTFIFRGEVMRKSKIRSKTTYHRCITDLNRWGYITYHPSKDAFKGSVIEMTNPEKLIKEIDDSEINRISAGSFKRSDENSEDEGEGEDLKFPNSKKDHLSEDSRLENGQKMVQPCSKDNQKMVHPSPKEDQSLVYPCPEEDQKMVLRCPEEGQNLVPSINTYKHINIKKKNKPESEKEVTDFFKSKKWKMVEGQKFFHHYQSIGWKKGGVTPLTDWRAAAESWVLRGMELRALEVPPVRMRNQDNLKITKAKHYDKPL